MSEHFVQLTLENKTRKDRISTDGCHDVAGFLKAIRASPQLSIGDGIITLFQPDGTTEIDPETPVTELKEIPWKPMVVNVEKLPVPDPIGSARKQLNYKRLGVEASCRKYMDALAKQIALFYQFDWAHAKYPTFGDVLFAYQKNDGSYRFKHKTEVQRTDESGFTQIASPVPFLPVRLSDLFDADEWAKLNKWNQKTNSRIHDAVLPRTSTKKYFVIVPHADYNQETIEFLKTIGMKAQLFDDEIMLEVKDESNLSISSGSEPTSADKDKNM